MHSGSRNSHVSPLDLCSVHTYQTRAMHSKKTILHHYLTCITTTSDYRSLTRQTLNPHRTLPRGMPVHRAVRVHPVVATLRQNTHPLRMPTQVRKTPGQCRPVELRAPVRRHAHQRTQITHRARTGSRRRQRPLPAQHPLLTLKLTTVTEHRHHTRAHRLRQQQLLVHTKHMAHTTHTRRKTRANTNLKRLAQANHTVLVAPTDHSTVRTLTQLLRSHATRTSRNTRPTDLRHTSNIPTKKNPRHTSG